ncbi:MAG: histidine phosphatase family protein [Chloroflexi bacterium]|nr:histidine phosphatase family protein [Chloroflexota bacterium]
MTEILIVRHGETAWNVQEVSRGRKDVALNETGMKQTARLAAYLRNVKIEAIYSSPLKRAWQTAEAIAGHHSLPVIEAPGLIDLDYGEWEGLEHAVVAERYPELYRLWLSRPQQVQMPGGEGLRDVRRRARKAVKEVVARHSGSVVLVAHRVVNKVLICALLGLSNAHFWNIRQDTCGITTFAWQDGRSVLVSHNDTSFLRPLGQTKLADF